jgi:hypothetical protein
VPKINVFYQFYITFSDGGKDRKQFTGFSVFGFQAFLRMLYCPLIKLTALKAHSSTLAHFSSLQI